MWQHCALSLVTTSADVCWVLFWRLSEKHVKSVKGILALCPCNWWGFFLCLLDATVYVGGLDEKVSEPLLWELFLQAGPVVNTHMPKDRVTGQHQGKQAVCVLDSQWYWVECCYCLSVQASNSEMRCIENMQRAILVGQGTEWERG